MFFNAFLYFLEFGFPNYLVRRPGSPLIRLFGAFLFLPWALAWAIIAPVILLGGMGIEKLVEVWNGTL